MILQGHFNAAYLVAPEAQSCYGGYHFLGNKQLTLFNGPILVLAKVIKNIMSSAAEAEVTSLYLNTKDAVPIRQCLHDMGHLQLATHLTTDNSVTQGIIRGTMKQQQAKAFDIQTNWIRNRCDQE